MMKINRVDNKTRKIESGSKEKVIKSGEFADAFDNANRNQTEQQLQEMLKDIEKLGGRLTKTKTLEDAQLFRGKIREYLSYIIKNAYLVKRDSTSFSFSIHTRVEIINEKLDELTKEVLGQQKEAIDIADKIDEIKGLLVDVMQ
jgi:uncharacterized protein